MVEEDTEPFLVTAVVAVVVVVVDGAVTAGIVVVAQSGRLGHTAGGAAGRSS